MAAAAPSAGSIVLTAQTAGGRFVTAGLANERPLVAGRLEGRAARDAPALAGLLLAVCGTAQTAASLMAVEQALGLRISAAQIAARRLMILAEEAVNLAWRVALDWAPLAGRAADPAPVAALKRAAAGIGPALFAEGRWAVPGGARLQPDRNALAAAVAAVDRIASSLFAEASDPELTPSELDVWLRRGASVPAALIAEARTEPLRGFGGHRFARLQGLPASWYGARLAADPDFARLPTIDGAPAESLPGAGDPRVAAMADLWGEGLAWRLFALASGLATIGARMAEVLPALAPETPARAADSGSGEGVGFADTARGLLVHWTRVADGEIASYRTLAPTEWNFHPAGPVVDALLRAPNLPDPGRAARLLAASFDPCVPISVEVTAAEGPGGADRPARAPAHA